MNKEKLKELYEKYELNPNHFFKHQHYTIITRQGIDKIQAIEQISIDYEVIKCEISNIFFFSSEKYSGRHKILLEISSEIGQDFLSSIIEKVLTEG